MGEAVLSQKQSRLRAIVSHDLEILRAWHTGVCCSLRRNLEMLLFMGAKIALAQLSSFIFFKNE
jgi:hypothetical protein